VDACHADDPGSNLGDRTTPLPKTRDAFLCFSIAITNSISGTSRGSTSSAARRMLDLAFAALTVDQKNMLFFVFPCGFFGGVMLVHTHTAAVSTWSHVGHVEKNPYTTPHQALKTIAKAKQNLPLRQSCGCRKTFPLT
jgi:hypothetical protein